MYGYFANKNKYRLIVKNIYKNMTIYLKNRKKNEQRLRIILILYLEMLNRKTTQM